MEYNQGMTERGQIIPRVSIGLLTYKRPELFKRALKCLYGQTYKNFEIIISDNDPFSINEKIVKEICGTDSRVSYKRQSVNIGGVANFFYVLKKASAEYFMWAADDDEWSPDFLAETVSLLNENPTVGAAFTNFCAKTSSGQIIARYSDFNTRLSEFKGKTSFNRLKNFILQKEHDGKANLIYSLFRKSLLDQISCFSCKYFGSWGGDMLTVAQILSLSDFDFSPRMLYTVMADDGTITHSEEGQQKTQSKTELIRGHAKYCLTYIPVVAKSPLLTPVQKCHLTHLILIKCFSWLVSDVKKLREP